MIRRLAARALLVLISSAVAIKLGDLVVAAIDPAGISHFENKRRFDSTMLKNDRVAQNFTQAFLVPGSSIHAGVHYRVNSLGFRGPEVTEKKPPDTWRLVLLGDSVTFGWGVEEDDRFSAVVERALEDRYREGPSIQVLNLAVPGYETTHQHVIWRRLGRRLEPDVVVVVFNQNDVQTTPDSLLEIERLGQDRMESAGGLAKAVLRGPVSRFMTEWLPNLRHLALYHFIFRTTPGDERTLAREYASMESGIRVSLDLLRRTRDDATNLGARFAVLDLQRFDAIREGCQALGIPYRSICYDNYLTDMSLRNSAADPHPNARGHALLAKNFLSALEELQLLPGDPR